MAPKGIARNRAGFTIVELLISLTVGLVIVSAAVSFAITTFRGVEGGKLREEVYRNSRFIGMSLQRDAQTTGVGIESLSTFGTVSTFNDTLMFLHVPWEPSLAYPYEINPPFDTLATNPLPAGGTCGALCIDLNKGPGNTFDIVPGDLARLQVNSLRRLILVTGVSDLGTTVELTFAAGATLLHLPAALSGGLLLDRFSTFVQKIDPIVYFVQDSTLFRADRLDTSGGLIASPVANGVHAWNAMMIFTDLDEADAADVADVDFTNDFDDILGVRIITTLGTNRPDIRVAQGSIFERVYEWKLLPRNLMYERNR